jgi:HEAT repeat protein
MSKRNLMLATAGLSVVAAAGIIAFAAVAMSNRHPDQPTTCGKPPVSAKPASSGSSSYLLTEKDPPTRADPQLTKRLIDTRRVENTADVLVIILDIKKDPTTRNEAANLLRRSECLSLTENLVRSLGSAEEGPLWRSYCIQHLYMNSEKAMPDEKEKIAGVLRSSLSDRHTRVRREALLALCRLKDPLGQETAVKWLTAKEGEGPRDVAIRCCEDLGLCDQAPAVRKLATDPDESTAVQAIGTLGRWGDEASRPLFEDAAKSKSLRLQNAAKAALKRLDVARATPGM